MLFSFRVAGFCGSSVSIYIYIHAHIWFLLLGCDDEEDHNCSRSVSVVFAVSMLQSHQRQCCSYYSCFFVFAFLFVTVGSLSPRPYSKTRRDSGEFWLAGLHCWAQDPGVVRFGGVNGLGV